MELNFYNFWPKIITPEELKAELEKNTRKEKAENLSRKLDASKGESSRKKK